MVVLEFKPLEKIIEVKAPDTEIDIQTLINMIRDWEDDHLEWGQVAEATGKDSLGGGLYTAITVKLLGWKLKFEDRAEPTVCMVRGGNLLAVDEYGNYVYPIAPAENVTVSLVQSTAASLIAEWTQSEKDLVITRTGYIPEDLSEVPTLEELNNAHGSGSWEGTKPEEVWSYGNRSLVTRKVGEEYIASQDTLEEVKALLEEIKGMGVVPKSISQYLEKKS